MGCPVLRDLLLLRNTILITNQNTNGDVSGEARYNRRQKATKGDGGRQYEELREFSATLTLNEFTQGLR